MEKRAITLFTGILMTGIVLFLGFIFMLVWNITIANLGGPSMTYIHGIITVLILWLSLNIFRIAYKD